ncbi:MAG: histidine kinase [Cyanobacteria bacterium DS2.3.42]|nr:histidine kinase [Cyanobacteria bacterium DS2.3.42]
MNSSKTEKKIGLPRSLSMETQLTTGFGILLGLATFMFGAFFFISSSSVNSSINLQKRHTYLEELRATREALTRTESLTRAYLLDPQETYSNQFNTTASSIPVHLQTLYGAVPDWYERRNLSRLNDISVKRITQLMGIIHERSTKGMDSAVQKMREYDKADDGATLETLIERLEVNQKELLQTQLDESQNVFSQTAWGFGLLGIFVFCGYFYLVRRMYSGISYRRQIEDEVAHRATELSQLNDKLVESERVKSEFVATVSHELRTPLTLILAPIESILAGDAGELNEEQSGHLKTMHNNTIRLLQLITGLLDFSRLEAGKIELRPEPTDVVALTKSILADFTPALKQKQLTMVSNLPETSAHIEIDRYLYERILFNLVSNAIKFTQINGIITVGLVKEAGDQWLVTVKDTGIGIPESDIALVFQRFRQAEAPSTRRFEGAGLGLALVVEFSRLLGGQVTVESKLGVGSQFSVSFTGPESTSGKQKESAQSRKVLVPQYGVKEIEALPKGGHKPTVLIAEDNTELSAYIASVLDSFCRVIIAKDGQEALDLMKASAPDLLISDIMMPEIDGLTLCKEIKADPILKSTPVVLLTALTNRDSLLKGWESGADEYLFKPFHPKELTTRIKGILAGVAERKRAEMLALQQQKAQQTRDFMSTLAHDMQVPLLGSSRVFEMLLDGKLGEVPDEIRTLIGQIQERNKFLLKLTECLLEIYRYESGGKDMEFTDVDTGNLVKEVAADFSKAAETKHIEMQCSAQESMQKINADEKALKLLLTHLIDNAIKYGAESSTVEIKQVEDGEDLVIAISNTGSFIDDDSQKVLFEKFWRGQPGKRFVANTGLGLYLCKRIVDAHGGTILCSSKEGKETTFTVTLPLAKQQKLKQVTIEKAEQVNEQ